MHLVSRGLTLLLLGSLATAPMAGAVITNHSGTICKNYNASEVSSIDYLVNGTRSLQATTTYLICPLTRNTSNSGGAWVYVDVTNSGSHTTSCTAYSYDYNGTFLGSSSATWTGSGFHEFALNLTGTGKSTSWSDYSVLCSVPGSASGLIMGVDLSEL
jgi:hypothetical protein